jgi:hypothetical protein
MKAGCSDAETKQITGHKSDCWKGYERPNTEVIMRREAIKLGQSPPSLVNPATVDPATVNPSTVNNPPAIESSAALTTAPSSPTDSNIAALHIPVPPVTNANMGMDRAAIFFGKAMHAFLNNHG